MKTRMNLRSAVLLVFSHASGSGSSRKRKVYFKILNLHDKYRIIYQSVNVTSVSFKIRDLEGQLIYDKVINKLGGPEQTFDLSRIPTGRYELELVNIEKVDKEEITFENWRAQNLEIRSTEKPRDIRLEGINSFGSDLTFKVLDSAWNEYMVETIQDKQHVDKKYNLKELDGDFTNLVLFNDEDIVKHAQFSLAK